MPGQKHLLLWVHAVLGEAGQGAGSHAGEVEAALPPSVAEVLTAEAGLRPHHSQALLVSRGHGDLALLVCEAGGVALTGAVHPLRPPPPLQGMRPFYLEAAMQVHWAVALHALPLLDCVCRLISLAMREFSAHCWLEGFL
jgi:hypothetical protein